MEWLDRYFQISTKGSNIRTELLAGLATFLTMAVLHHGNYLKALMPTLVVRVSGVLP